ncbi:hypothetical protein [Candidatus Chloroploca asiatica]|uniref:Uncharacterized protein n=1 Tax=Candidatus Chloroploca asiatica TaxID=1506545 RepID=A0A2H3KRU4_9CHLR|nr:hypothetical protein [Candidatus Chloroploca asiatica]PDV96542.1 hypothetical protein A9Q02_06185 [Candidatus Chloroploca asiatica]
MSPEMITIAVDTRVAQAFHALSEEDQRKIGVLLSLRILEATQTTESLEDLMRRIGQNARERGLTPEILADILRTI